MSSNVVTCITSLTLSALSGPVASVLFRSLSKRWPESRVGGNVEPEERPLPRVVGRLFVIGCCCFVFEGANSSPDMVSPEDVDEAEMANDDPVGVELFAVFLSLVVEHFTGSVIA